MEFTIKNIDGSIIVSVAADDNAVYHEELMTSDYIKLSWQSENGNELPVGSYIEYDGEKYRLLEPYKPQLTDEVQYSYTPQFQSRVMNWGKQITPIYTYEEDGSTVKSREMDWTFTGSPADAMYIVKQAIKNETGEEWTIQLADNLPATITISAQSSNILAILSSIATECDTEFWADKKTNTLYLSKCIFGEPVTLTVGDNVKIPSITSSNQGYYTRFYAFGSTRNIPQTTVEGEANVNKRLTLDPAKYPNGYKDIREGLIEGEIFPKTLYFDDIYPSSKLTISDVRARLRYRLDNNGNKIQIGGTEEEPIYEQYAIWYFQIAGFTFDPTSVIEGLNLSVSFESGQLNGRDFELTYHEKSQTVSDANDVTPFEIKAGDYEIVIDETSGQIIPGTSYIIPQEDDMVILYNIKMPAEYTSSAQLELESELNKAIAKQLEDNNTYNTSSNPVSFYNEGIDLKMGMSVNFVYLGNTLQTRVMMIEKKLDLPCYQSFSVGNKVIKGNTQQLKDEVANANQNIDIIKAFNDLSNSLSQAYANAQREMIEGFAAIKNLWQLKQDDEGNYYAYTEYDVLGKKGITAYSAGTAQVPSIFEGIPLDNKTIWRNPDTGLIEVIGGTGGGGDFNSNKMWELLLAETTEQINISHLKDALNGYATETWVNNKGFATQTWVNNKGYITQTIADERYVNVTGDTMTGNLTIANGSSSKLTLWDSSAYLMQKSISGLDGYWLYLYGSSGSYVENKLYVSSDALINGNLGIGTTSPTQRLHVSGGALIEESTFINCKETAKFLFFIDNGNSANLGGYVKYTPADKLVLGTRGTAYVDTEALYITRGSKDVTVVGDLIVKGNILSEGGITAYSLGDRTQSTIMDGVAVDGTTISKEGGVLKVIGGTGGGGGSTTWDDITGKPTWLTTSKPSVSYFTNDAGYLTESQLGDTYVKKAGDTMTGNLTINNGSSSRLTLWDSSAYLMQKSMSEIGGYGLYLYGSNGTYIQNKLYVSSNAYVNGNLGIGTTSPSQKLHVSGGALIEDSTYIDCGGATKYFFFIDNGNSTNYGGYIKHIAGSRMVLGTRGTAYSDTDAISISRGSKDINVYGNIYATGSITGNTSDQRAKTILEELNINLKDIANAPTIRFKWNGWKIKDDGKTHIGGLAQYMKKVLPEAVLNEDDMLYMDYSTTAYIFSVQTARHLVKTETEVQRLKKRVKKLEKKLKSLGYEEANIVDD